MDVRLVVQCIGKCKEIVGIKEVFTVEKINEGRNLAFLGARVHGGMVRRYSAMAIENVRAAMGCSSEGHRRVRTGGCAACGVGSFVRPTGLE